MTRRRWIADEFSGDRAALTGAHAAHLSRTLRARVGQQFEVACGEHLRRATVSSVEDERVEFTLGEEVTAREAVPITLLLAVFKFDRMEWAIEKCTELNVTTIVPVIARRTEKHLALAANKRVERWRRIAREAAEQSRRIAPPEIADPVKLKEALANFHDSTIIPHADSGLSRGTCGHADCDLRIVLAETGPEATLSEVLRARDNVTSLALAIGPEGGWTTEDLQLFKLSQWLAASLGDTILRAETAAISAVAIARAEL
ncbi:MAG: RsmE family RNA methyltransferase [Candidatus Korobacteraceae bacterium]|jgi:16S rRNA (uracil1498-N3)-methyltransferase